MFLFPVPIASCLLLCKGLYHFQRRDKESQPWINFCDYLVGPEITEENDIIDRDREKKITADQHL